MPPGELLARAYWGSVARVASSKGGPPAGGARGAGLAGTVPRELSRRRPAPVSSKSCCSRAAFCSAACVLAPKYLSCARVLKVSLKLTGSMAGGLICKAMEGSMAMEGPFSASPQGERLTAWGASLVVAQWVAGKPRVGTSRGGSGGDGRVAPRRLRGRTCVWTFYHGNTGKTPTIPHHPHPPQRGKTAGRAPVSAGPARPRTAWGNCPRRRGNTGGSRHGAAHPEAHNCLARGEGAKPA
jgi:hypothetical protein